MKKIALALIVWLCTSIQLYAQECEVISRGVLAISYPVTQINLFDEFRLDLSKLPLLDPSVKNFSSDSVYRAYIAPSDSTVMIFLVEDQVTFFKFCSSKKECDSLVRELYIGSLIVEEFHRLQSAGVLPGSATEADSMIRHVIDVMENRESLYATDSLLKSLGDTLNLGLDTISISLSNGVYNEGKAGDKASFYVSAASFCNYRRNGLSFNFCGLVDSVRQCPELFQEEAPLSLKSPVPQVPIQGMYFRAFDLNGNLIRSGKWREEYADEFRTPTIVRFENGLAVPLPRKKVH
ncbi:hypothetical protein [uncultured Fibrobacter sp.]|uniref:hypothetical protein n=1 Tax=uncultured Fibrobacter sp. TaxID=261512 RepID=UPI002614007D|nr:hypothetical protein [uncultured Fibrobacter sp.]